jgi:hypothetical protein
MTLPPEGAGAPPNAPGLPDFILNPPTSSATGALPQQNCDRVPLVCGAQKSRGETFERESATESRAIPLLRLIVAKLTEVEAQMKSPLAVRQLHLRYCKVCGVRVTNRNVGGYEGRSALTGRLYCELCADDLEDPQ